MFVSYHTCDHCSKKLDEMHDFCDGEVDIPYHAIINVDLCKECSSLLSIQVLDFVGRHTEENNK